MKVFGREPALVLAAFSASLSLIVSFRAGLSAEQAAGWVAALGAVFAVLTAVAVRPIAPAAFTGAVVAGVALLAAYGLHVSAEQVGALNAVVLGVLGLVTRGQVSPAVGSRAALE